MLERASITSDASARKALRASTETSQIPRLPVHGAYLRTKRDPRLTLVCLGLFHEPEDASLKRLRSVFRPTNPDLHGLVETLRTDKLIVSSQLKLSSKGREELRTRVAPVLLQPSKNIADIYRAFVSSTLLEQRADAATFKVLTSGYCVCAALAAQLVSQDVQLPFDDQKALPRVAARAVIVKYLTSMAPSLKVSPITSLDVEKDPVLLDIFEAATGHRSLDAGFRVLAAKALKTSSIPATDARWRNISQAGFDSMAPSPLHQRENQTDQNALISVIERIARTSPTGWASIFKAFEAYREGNRIALAEFKAAIEAAARADKLELAPLNVPSLQTENERAQSALVMGGLTYHLVRLPK